MSSIEELSKSLVREYLSRKGLKKTLSVLDEEMPRNSQSISNRQILAKTMHIEYLMKKNKEDSVPLKTMIEVMTQYFVRKGGAVSTSGATDDKKRKSRPLQKNDVEPSRILVAMPPKATATTKKEDSLLFEDIEDEVDISPAPRLLQNSGFRGAGSSFQGVPIDLSTAMSLKSIIFGNAITFFNSEWQRQSFVFCDICNLEYGLVQFKGGPCGLLASLQAYVLKHLLFTEHKPRFDERERRRALLDAMADILWQCGGGQRACLARVSSSEQRSFVGSVPGRYKSDRLTERLTLMYADTKADVATLLKNNISQFENSSGNGAILFLYCVILSRGLENVMLDMDDSKGRLMGMHGYCTQEMVNLIITGRASSNVFNGEIDLDTGGSKTSLLKGIEKRCDVGFLSLFEHYGSCQVGSFLKSPKYPIWLVCSESHFTVLFSSDVKILDDSKKRFDLFYYDGLAKQDEPIRLTIAMGGEGKHAEKDLIPPLELCIQTKWKRCSVDWNDTEPLL
ncbi:probable ubiquitin carboxyl-terminal hydrolase MINDY-4 isoform X2 [Oscarella lobularis]|uniref:probable ubiquitin carboxyl-terminal hydrolase MINDY-4 isoform X2 n=1 Tax=Oscarella lobularis TaxID=121494 RepID=UPI003313C469